MSLRRRLRELIVPFWALKDFFLMLGRGGGQIGTGVLAVGLPSSIKDSGLLRPSQRRDRLVRYSRHRPLHVSARRLRLSERRCVSLSDSLPCLFSSPSPAINFTLCQLIPD